MKIKSAIISDIGNIRSNNEDNFYYNGIYLTQNDCAIPINYSSECRDDLQFYAVCDGMGGEEMGEEASFLAVYILEKYQKKLKEITYHSLSKYMDMYLAEVTAQITSFRKANGNCRMGTTIALLVIEKEMLHIFNIGDSRIYLLRSGRLKQLTEDHTPAMRAFQIGIITKEEMKCHPHRNKLTQYLGIALEELTLMPFYMELKPRNKDRIFICSDGVTDMMEEECVRKILMEQKDSESAVNRLVEKAKANGGRDNITAIVLDVEKKWHLFDLEF